MQNLNNLFTFVQVVSHGGYAAAARITGVQKSTLSRYIVNLEDFLQATLIYRSNRRFVLTEVGTEYYRQCLVVLENSEAAIGGLGIASLPLWAVGDDIKTGQLIQIRPDYRLYEPVIHAVYPATKARAPNIRAFVSYLSKVLSLPNQ